MKHKERKQCLGRESTKRLITLEKSIIPKAPIIVENLFLTEKDSIKIKMHQGPRIISTRPSSLMESIFFPTWKAPEEDLSCMGRGSSSWIPVPMQRLLVLGLIELLVILATIKQSSAHQLLGHDDRSKVFIFIDCLNKDLLTISLIFDFLLI